MITDDDLDTHHYRTCSTVGCDRRVRTRGMCQSHYVREWRRERPRQPDCSVMGCGNEATAKGMCSTHRKRLLKYGDTADRTPTEVERFWRAVDVGDCWEWMLSTTGNGYGVFSVSGKNALAHRWSYENLVEPVPDGLVIDHLCRNRLCVNPDHMEPVTNAENVRRGYGICGNTTASRKRRSR